MGLYLLERSARVRELGVEAATGLFELGDPLGGGRGLGTRPGELGGGALALLGERGSGGAGRGGNGVLALVSLGQDGWLLAERPERDDGAGRLVLAGLRVAGNGRRDPVHDRAMALLEAVQAGHARADDLERLEKAVEFEAVVHLDRHEREVHLHLRAVLAPCRRLHVPAGDGDRAGNHERLE